MFKKKYLPPPPYTHARRPAHTQSCFSWGSSHDRFFYRNSNKMEYSYHFNSIVCCHITTQFCTCPECTGVVSYAKCYRDHFTTSWRRVDWNFYRIWITSKNSWNGSQCKLDNPITDDSNQSRPGMSVLRNARLTHWGRDQIDAMSQTRFSNAFPRMKMNEFGIGFHWSLFLRFELTIVRHWLW